MSEEEIAEPIAAEKPPEEDFKDKYLRLLAEMENSRKRMFKERQESIRFATERVLAEIILPLDNFEMALAFTDKMSAETKQWATGFQMILGQFKELLERQGVVPFHSKGELFDPEKHEAVEIEESTDAPEGTIIQEFTKGYRCGDRTIKPARVKVTKAPTQLKGEETV